MDPGLSYPTPLLEGAFLRRYKRFFADVLLDDGREVVAHCPNTGKMLGVNRPGSRCRVSHHDDPKRKLAYTLEQIEADGTWVMVNTARPNRIVEAAILAGGVPSLAGYDGLLREQRYGDNSRIDLLLVRGGELAPGSEPKVTRKGTLRPAREGCWVEIKNVTLVRDGVAAFPDTVSARGTKHLIELAELARRGCRAVLVPHIARSDAQVFAPAEDLDPAWAEAFRAAVAAGVEVLPLVCGVEKRRLVASTTLPWRMTLAG